MTHRTRSSAQAGFTLIELMITVAIVGILAAIAYPSYLDSVRKGKRAEGRTALIDFMQQQERYLTQMGSYLAVTPGQSGVAFKTFSGDDPSRAAYKIGAEACPDPGSGAPSLRECVRVIAEPQFTDDDVGTLRITSTGLRDCTGNKTAMCWK